MATQMRFTRSNGARPTKALHVVSPAPLYMWQAIWEASREATIFHRPEWLAACCHTEGFEDASRLYETVDGARIVFPLVRSPALLPRWRTTWSMPVGWGLGGAFGSRALRTADVASMLNHLRGDAGPLVISPGPVTGGAWESIAAPVRVRHDAHVVDVRGGFEALWSKAFSSDTRNKVRKARKRGVEVEWGPGSELVDVHWDIYLRWTRQRAATRGIPAAVALALAKRREPLVRYQAIATHLGERCQVAVARVDGEPAASVIALVGGVHAHYWRATSDQALVRRRYANHLLVASVLERAAADGSAFVHMGESGGRRSLIEFKEHFGARPVSYHELRFGPTAVTKAVRARERLVQAAEGFAVRSVARGAPS
jgi:putative intracellular protease/amidase